MTNDQTVTQALEPCPFCGAEDIRTMVGVGDGDRGYSMLCGGCGIRQGSAGRTKEQAITAWNTRTAHSGEGRSNGAGEFDPSKMSVEMADLFGLVCKLNRLKTERDDLMRTDGGFSVIERAADMMDEIVDAVPALQSAFNKVCERERLLLAALSAPQGEVDWTFIRECVEEARSDHVGYHESNKPGEPDTSKYDAALKALAALAQPEAGGE